MKALCLAGVVLLTANVCGQAQDLDGKMQGLQKVGEEFAAASAMGSGSDSLRVIAEEYREFSSNFSSLQSYVQNGNYEQGIQTLKQWLARTKNEQIKKSLTGILQALEKEQEARRAALAAQADQILAEAARAVAAAKTPDEAARVQIRLEEFRDFDLNQRGDRSSRVLSNRANRAIQFVNNWQQVLAAEEMGDFRSALQSLDFLRRNPTSYQLLDSKALAAKYEFLLERALQAAMTNEPPSPFGRVISQTMEKVKSPADAAAAAATLETLTRVASGSDNQLANQVQNQLDRLADMNDNFVSGAYARVINVPNDNFSRNAYSPRIEALADQLRIRAVAAANDLPDLGTSKEGEGFSSFIRRLAVEAFEKKDWPRLYTLLSVYSSVSGGGCARTSHMKDGVEAFLAAQQLEQAGQFRDAVRHYSDCLSEIGNLVPREEAAAALVKLRGAHPEAFEAR